VNLALPVGVFRLVMGKLEGELDIGSEGLSVVTVDRVGTSKKRYKRVDCRSSENLLVADALVLFKKPRFMS